MEIDAQNYNSVVHNIFKPVYSAIADQIIERTGITSGSCLDIGCGTGGLGEALARVSQLYMHFFDQSADMIEIVKQRILDNNLQERADAINGDVASIDLPDNSIDLAVSRGSVFFWENLPQAFREIHRVLAPQGWAYIGGGFGSKEIRESIKKEMISKNDKDQSFQNHMRRNLSQETHERFEIALKEAGIDSYTILHNENIGLWILMRK